MMILLKNFVKYVPNQISSKFSQPSMLQQCQKEEIHRNSILQQFHLNKVQYQTGKRSKSSTKRARIILSDFTENAATPPAAPTGSGLADGVTRSHLPGRPLNRHEPLLLAPTRYLTTKIPGYIGPGPFKTATVIDDLELARLASC